MGHKKICDWKILHLRTIFNSPRTYGVHVLPVIQKRTCGSCTLCCKLLGVAELDKEKGKWCARCAIGTGCTIYEDRPKSCKDFACMWLQYEEMPEEWRPDKVKLFIWEPNHSKFNQFQVNVDDKVDWKSKPIAPFINRISKLKPVVVIQGDYRTIITEKPYQLEES